MRPPHLVHVDVHVKASSLVGRLDVDKAKAG